MKQLLFLFTVLSICSGSVMAEPFQVTPMRLELEAGGDIGNVTIFNSGDSAMNMQVSAMAWAQDKQSGDDQLVDTKALVFFPKIFSVPAKGKQVIRVGYQGKVEGNEKSFRLFIRELPVDKPGVTGARFVVQISMPAFIYPKGVKQPMQASMHGIEVHNGKLELRADNPGKRYYSLNKIEMTGKHGTNAVYHAEVGGWYVLAGASRLFPLKISQEDCLKMDTLEITSHVLIDQGKEGDTSQATFPVTQAMCQAIGTKHSATP